MSLPMWLRNFAAVNLAVIKNEKLWVCLGFYPFDPSLEWDCKNRIFHFGPFSLYYQTGLLAKLMVTFPRWKGI